MKIIIDTREQRPFEFLGQNGDITTERGTLALRDYSLAGLTDRVAVERKSLADLVMCLGEGRRGERFQRELMRAAALEAFAVVVESSWQDLAAGAVGRLCGAVPGKTGAALFSAWCKVAGVVAGCDLKKVAGW